MLPGVRFGKQIALPSGARRVKTARWAMVVGAPLLTKHLSAFLRGFQTDLQNIHLRRTMLEMQMGPLGIYNDEHSAIKSAPRSGHPKEKVAWFPLNHSPYRRLK
jgi:hypothetical protein